MSKLGIEETKQVIDFVDFLADEMKTAKEGDGKIEFSELITAILGNPDLAFKASWGIWDVDDELADLSPDEVRELIFQIMPIVKKFADLFI